MPPESSEAAAARPALPFSAFEAMVGGPAQASDWMVVDQARLDGFAKDTGDDAFIHIDPERARATRFGGTIAHGLLTLSLLPFLMRSAMPAIADLRMGVNYGFDRVRFLAPVPVDSRVRAQMKVIEARHKRPDFATLTYDVLVEIEGSDQPALAALWTLGAWLRASQD